MSSLRKIKKKRWMSVNKMIKEIKSYRHKFSYKYGCGYFIFNFNDDEYNLHITFDKLPNMKFGVWYTTKYGEDKYYFFAEHCAFIDKFKPSAVTFNWDTLDQMMTFVHDSILDNEYYMGQLAYAYPMTFNRVDCKEYINTLLKMDNGFTFEERNEYLKKFNALINSLDTEKYDIFWVKSSVYKTLYHVFYYVATDVSDDGIIAFEKALQDCKCLSLGGLNNDYWKHRKQYQMKIHPGNKILYTNYKVWRKYFKK